MMHPVGRVCLHPPMSPLRWRAIIRSGYRNSARAGNERAIALGVFCYVEVEDCVTTDYRIMSKTTRYALGAHFRPLVKWIETASKCATVFSLLSSAFAPLIFLPK